MREEGREHTSMTASSYCPPSRRKKGRPKERDVVGERRTSVEASSPLCLVLVEDNQLTLLKQSKKSAQLVFLFFIERALARRKVQPLSDWRGAISRQRIYRDTVHWAAIVYCRILYGELNAIDSRPHWQQLFPPPARPRGHLRALPARQKQQQPVAVSIFDAVLDAVPPFFWRLLVPSAEHPRRPPSIPPA